LVFWSTKKTRTIRIKSTLTIEDGITNKLINLPEEELDMYEIDLDVYEKKNIKEDTIIPFIKLRDYLC